MPQGALRVINRIFPYNPSYPVQTTPEWSTLVPQYREADQSRSLVSRPKRTWSLQWDSLTKIEKDAIRDFYHARKGGFGKFLFLAYKDYDDDSRSDIIGTAGSSSNTTQIYLQNAPAEDDLYNNWTIEIDVGSGAEHKIITDYDGSNQVATTQAFTASTAGKQYTLRQSIGVGNGTKTAFDLVKNYNTHSETKKYMYDESTSGGVYEPKVWTHDGSTITTQVWSTNYTYTQHLFANNDRQYYEGPINFVTAPTNGHSVIASWYYLYPVRFHPDDALNKSLFTTNLYELNTIRLVEVYES